MNPCRTCAAYPKNPSIISAKKREINFHSHCEGTKYIHTKTVRVRQQIMHKMKSYLSEEDKLKITIRKNYFERDTIKAKIINHLNRLTYLCSGIPALTTCPQFNHISNHGFDEKWENGGRSRQKRAYPFENLVNKSSISNDRKAGKLHLLRCAQSRCIHAPVLAYIRTCHCTRPYIHTCDRIIVWRGLTYIRPKAEDDEPTITRNRRLLQVGLLDHLKKAKDALEKEKNNKTVIMHQMQNKRIEDKLKEEKKNFEEIELYDLKKKIIMYINDIKVLEECIKNDEGKLMKLTLVNHYEKMKFFISTNTYPTIFWCPIRFNDKTRNLQKNTQEFIKKKIDAIESSCYEVNFEEEGWIEHFEHLKNVIKRRKRDSVHEVDTKGENSLGAEEGTVDVEEDTIEFEEVEVEEEEEEEDERKEQEIAEAEDMEDDTIEIDEIEIKAEDNEDNNTVEIEEEEAGEKEEHTVDIEEGEAEDKEDNTVEDNTVEDNTVEDNTVEDGVAEDGVAEDRKVDAGKKKRAPPAGRRARKNANGACVDGRAGEVVKNKGKKEDLRRSTRRRGSKEEKEGPIKGEVQETVGGDAEENAEKKKKGKVGRRGRKKA
ncbi:conserved Plasmodium protein, unknown function [Plasmodium ovale wallikeri]|uniref:Pinin/SDK/MemA protein domain-containing protein n=1 Tax=Plasmodium ovale wallikeri TaxID=864142 RepID=A0A1A8ZU96_PLAOA|nr:conserved Plasmodium protein, unknown function [Plasmodium ovale wallikeri]SBT48079.1 conserved Plasmodium protein, unknown function [Plasmodium ovale wallikeri]